MSKFIDFHHLDPCSYDPVMILTIILMAFAEDGYASLRREDGTSVCPAGHAFEIERIGVNLQGQYPKTTVYYRNKNCSECAGRDKYMTSKRGRSARIVPALEKMHTEIDEYLKSEERG